jgi:hypothetical protein
VGDDTEPDAVADGTLRRRVAHPRSAVKFYARFGLGDASGNFRRDPRHHGLQGYSDRRFTLTGRAAFRHSGSASAKKEESRGGRECLISS